MKVLVIGHLGQLGSDLKKVFADEQLTLKGRHDLPVHDAAAVTAGIEECRPEIILNCSAFHRVDDCEDEPAQAFEVNVFGVRNLALAARRANAVLVHFSTDYVFDGGQRHPYVESDAPLPRCIYGVSKAAGEMMLASIWPKHFICRVSGLYGYAGSRDKGSNFVEMMIGKARQQQTIRVVNDQVLTPTNTLDAATAVRRLVGTQAYGLYHLTNTGESSWHEFTVAICDLAGCATEIIPVASSEFSTKANRPTYSVLDNRRYRELGFSDMPHWHDALTRYIAGRADAGRI